MKRLTIFILSIWFRFAAAAENITPLEQSPDGKRFNTDAHEFPMRDKTSKQNEADFGPLDKTGNEIAG